MSYNGIGLPSAKGSSTSGHIQRSLASNDERDNTKKKGYLLRQKQIQTKNVKKPVHHHSETALQNKRNNLRDIELQVSELRDRLEDEMDEGDKTITDDIIDKKCQLLREQLLNDMKIRTAYTNRKKRDSNKQSDDVDRKNLEY